MPTALARPARCAIFHPKQEGCPGILRKSPAAYRARFYEGLIGDPVGWWKAAHPGAAVVARPSGISPGFACSPHWTARLPFTRCPAPPARPQAQGWRGFPSLSYHFGWRRPRCGPSSRNQRHLGFLYSIGRARVGCARPVRPRRLT
jgi:hypothetical protein